MIDPEESANSAVSLESEGSDRRAVVDADALFRALADRTRRRVLGALLERQPTTIEELTDVLVWWKASDERLVDPDDRERIVVDLHHQHLPLLAEGGLLSRDPAIGETRLTPISEVVREAIRFANRYDDRAGTVPA